MDQIDVLEDVLISPDAADQWRSRAIEYIRSANYQAIAIDQIMDERATVEEDGTLRIFCASAQGEILVELIVPKNEWTWVHQPQ